MATSNSTDFTITATECIRMALEDINVVGEGDEVSAYDYGVAKNKLNLMIKAWQNQAEHLWVRQKIILFLQKGQSLYEISTSSSDHITADIISNTQLSADAALGASVLTVTSSTNFSNNDYIGIQLDDGTLFWTIISNVVSPTSIQITDVLTGAASSGRYVFGYTNQLTNVFNVYSATRRLISSSIDVPLLLQSYVEYTKMPNKSHQGTPNIWSYDRQIDKMLINIWLAPSNVDYYLNFVVDRKIQDIDTSIDNFDFPQEWAEAIVLNLAVKLAPTYGRAQGDNFQVLSQLAQESLTRALETDNEIASVYMVPSRSGMRGR